MPAMKPSQPAIPCPLFFVRATGMRFCLVYLFLTGLLSQPLAAHADTAPLTEQATAIKVRVLQQVQARLAVQAQTPQTQPQTQTPIQAQVQIDPRQLDKALARHPHLHSRQQTCSNAEVFLPDAPLRTHLSVGLRCHTSHTIHIPVKLRLMGQYPVAARPLPPNRVLGTTDIRLHTGDLLRLPPGAATRVQDVIGHTTTQRIASGQTFKHNTLRSPRVVQRGQPLILQIRGPGYTLTSTGTALQAGEPGSSIQARTASGLTVQGLLADAQTLVLVDSSGFDGIGFDDAGFDDFINGAKSVNANHAPDSLPAPLRKPAVATQGQTERPVRPE